MPELTPGLETYFDDYLALATFAGAERIRLSEIYAYAAHVQMGEEYLEDFLAFVPELDAVRLEYLRKKAEEETKR